MWDVVELADRVAIQRNVGDFADALDLKRWDMLDRVFTADATIRIGGKASSVAEAKAWLRRALDDESVRACLHMVGNLHIVLDGDRAQSFSRLFVPLELRTGKEVRLGFNGAWYAWKHVRIGDGWRIGGSLDDWAKPKPDWQPGFYGWATPPYPAAANWSTPMPDLKG